MLRSTKLTTSEYIWLGIIFWAVIFTAAEAPFSMAFDTKIQTWQLWIDFIFSIIFIIDLFYNIKKFKNRKKTSLIPKSEKKSLKAYFGFFIDTMACIPFDILFYFIGLAPGTQFLKLFRFFRLVRIIKIIHIFNELAIVPKWLRFQLLFIGSMIAIHFITCYWILLHPHETGTRMEYYVKCFYWTVTTLTTVGYGDITPTTTHARIYTMIVMISGVGFYGLVIGNISRIFAENARYKEQTREKYAELSSFMKHYHIPDRLQGAVFNYYNHLYSKRFSDNDQQIISELPHSLKSELQIYMSMKLVHNLPVFKNCSKACLKAIAASLEQIHYGPGDTIIRIGEIGDEMYVIGHGIVDVILKDGNAVAQLHEGQFFGEAALLKETTRNANVRAATYCDLYKLPKESFVQIIESFPELLENMQNVTTRRASDRRES